MKPAASRDVLMSLGLRITKARMGILEILTKNDTPLDVEAIWSRLHKIGIRSDLATVYRTLESFTHNQAVQKVEFREGKFRYELMRGDHHHTICERCGRIEDIQDCPIDDIVTSIERSKKFRAHRHAFELYGVCASCQGAYA